MSSDSLSGISLKCFCTRNRTHVEQSSCPCSLQLLSAHQAALSLSLKRCGAAPALGLMVLHIKKADMVLPCACTSVTTQSLLVFVLKHAECCATIPKAIAACLCLLEQLQGVPSSCSVRWAPRPGLGYTVRSSCCWGAQSEVCTACSLLGREGLCETIALCMGVCSGSWCVPAQHCAVTACGANCMVSPVCAFTVLTWPPYF